MNPPTHTLYWLNGSGLDDVGKALLHLAKQYYQARVMFRLSQQLWYAPESFYVDMAEMLVFAHDTYELGQKEAVEIWQERKDYEASLRDNG